jgi:hypothetical protein
MNIITWSIQYPIYNILGDQDTNSPKNGCYLQELQLLILQVLDGAHISL